MTLSCLSHFARSPRRTALAASIRKGIPQRVKNAWQDSCRKVPEGNVLHVALGSEIHVEPS
jgi:hypothetical protein